MKHGLIIMRPPHATQIITQHDGSIMLKFEMARGKDMTDMLQKAIDDILEIKVPLASSVIIPGPVSAIPVKVSKVVPDDGGLPQMRMVAPPAPDNRELNIIKQREGVTAPITFDSIPAVVADPEVAGHMEEANRRGRIPQDETEPTLLTSTIE